MSPGSTGFKAGTFEFTNWTEDITDLSNEDMTMQEFDTKYRNKAFIPLGLLVTDTDGDKNWEEETGLEITGGTIKVSGTSPNFSTEYDLTLEGGKTVKGSFAGKFNEVQ
jgi:hypothetical protein